MTSSFIPAVPGNWWTRALLDPVMHAATETATPAAAPLVMAQASTPASSAIRFPAFSRSSGMLTWDRPASCIAATTSGSMMDPPMEVPLAAALMRCFTASCS